MELGKSAAYAVMGTVAAISLVAAPSVWVNRGMQNGREAESRQTRPVAAERRNAAHERAASPLLIYPAARSAGLGSLVQTVGGQPAAGISGPGVLMLEQRLANLTYMTGKVDGVFDGATQHAVVAFQKVEGLPRTGQADPATLSRMDGAVPPRPAFTGPPNHLEVDTARQVVFVVRDGLVSATLPTSTGNNKLFRSQGRTRRAVTPDGQFQIGVKMNGWRKSPLGLLYRPSYFNDGIAFHGSRSVPTSPASHGCVRLPMAFADWFYENASPPGTVVHVYGG